MARFLRVALYCAALAAAVLSCRAGGNTDSERRKLAGGLDYPYLSALAISPDSLEFASEFASNNFNYAVTLPDNDVLSITLSAEVPAEHENDWIITYNPGQNFTMLESGVAVVGVEDGKTRTNYVIQFSKAPLQEARLSGVLFSAGELRSAFNAETFNYDVDVPFGTEEVTVSPFAAQYEQSLFTFYPYGAPVFTLSSDPRNNVMRVGVLAANYKVAYYNFTFHVSAALESALAGVTLSAGALTTQTGTPVSFNAGAGEADTQYVSVYTDTDGLVVNAVLENWSDAVRFVKDGVEQPLGTSCVFNKADFGGSLNDAEFQIKAHGGEGHEWKTYKFKIRTDAKQPAYLNDAGGLTVGAGNLYRRKANGDNDGTNAYLKTITSYNLNFAGGASNITITANAAGKSISINGGAPSTGTAQITVPAPSAALPPVLITVSDASTLPTTYAVYFKKTDPPYARLLSLAATGGAITPAFAPETSGLYTADMPANSNALILHGEAPDGFAVSYSPQNYALYSDPSVAQIRVTVSGGPDYVDTTYTVNIVRAANQQPRLASLSVNNENIPLGDSRLVYNKTIDYDAAPGAENITVAWTTPADVAHVRYSMNGGASWTAGSGSFTFTLAANRSETALLEVTTFDANMANYFITIKRGGPASGWLTFNYDYGTGNKSALLSSDGSTTVELPSFVTQVDFSASATALAGAATVLPASDSKTWTSQSDGSQKTGVITISGGAVGDTIVYVVLFSKKNIESTQNASGGAVTFVDNSNGTFDEVHTFNYNAANQTNGQTSYTFEVGERAMNAQAQVLVVAGGGAGGTYARAVQNHGGGAGAGGLIYYGQELASSHRMYRGGFYPLTSSAYSVKVGRGGNQTLDTANTSGESGKKSEFGTLAADGGGGGRGNDAAGINGGSGGGNLVNSSYSPGSYTSFSGIPLGNSGVKGVNGNYGGGGGAGGAGGYDTYNSGTGLYFTISGASKGYAGGGARGNGGPKYATANSPFGGGNAGWPGIDGTGGGGAGSCGNVCSGQAGGSGVVIVRFAWTE